MKKMKKATKAKLKTVGVVLIVATLMFFSGVVIAVTGGLVRTQTSIVSTQTQVSVVNGTTVTGTVVIQPEVVVSVSTDSSGVSTTWVTVTNSTTITVTEGT